MTWFGTVSAWAAAAMAAMFAVNAYFQFATGVSGLVYLAVAIWLALGAHRTLRKLSGGLRMLAGAWGLATGVLLLPWVTSPDGAAVHDPLAVILLLIAVIGLLLTVRLKETK